MKTNYFLLLLTVFSFIRVSVAQTTEVFESESEGSTSFTDNGQLFNISSSTSETFDILTANGAGWNGSTPDNRFVDNSQGQNGENNGSSITISADMGTDFRLNSLYLFCATSGIGNGSGMVTFEGRKDDGPVFTFARTSGFSNISTFTPNNGFTFIDFANDDTTDHSIEDIDELIITSTGSFDYLAIDAFSWTALNTDVTPPTIESIAIVGTPNSTDTSVDFEVTFNEVATNLTADDFSIDLTGTATGSINSILGSGMTYTINVTGVDGEGTVSIDLNANTDIIDAAGNGNGTNGNTPAFTAGENHVVSSCFEESFESLVVGATTFSSNGIDFTTTGLSVEMISNSAAGDSDFFVDNSGTVTTVSVATTGGELFTLGAIDLFLSSNMDGSVPTNDGTITLTGKVIGSDVFSITKSSDFPTSTTNGDNGFFNLNIATAGTSDFSFTDVDEIEITLGGSFTYIAIDHFEHCEDGQPDILVPEVDNIVLSGPTPLSTATSLSYAVTFNENVNNVTSDDFELETTGSLTANIDSDVPGSGNQYIIDIRNIVGEGTLKLSLKANTDIEDGSSNTPPLAFTNGQVYTRSECFVTTFESESTGAAIFSSNGLSFEVEGGLDIFESTGAGAGNSDKFLDNEGVGDGTYSIKTTDGKDFTMNTIGLYLSSIAAASSPTDDGSITIRGIENDVEVFTATLSDSNTTFPTSLSEGNNGFLVVDFSSLDGNDVTADLIDELEITIAADFVYVGVDNFDFCQDEIAPSGYAVTIDQSPINGGNDDAVSFTFSGAEVGATYNYTFTTSGGAGSVINSGVIATATDQITGIDLSGLADGTITLSVTLTDVNGNVGAPATDTETKETVAPSGYTVSIEQSPINGGNAATVSFVFAGAEVGSMYNYTFTSSGGVGSVTGSGTITAATGQIDVINLSDLADGTISLSVTLTDVNGNVGVAATDTETKETVAPSGYAVSIDQSPINGGNDDAVSFTFSGAEVGATYNYTFTTSGGAGSVTNSGVIATATDQITGIDLSGLADGTISLSVTLTDVNGNVGAAATDTETKETVAPSGYSVAIDQSPINGGNDDAVSFTFSGAEVGATYNYTFTTSGGAGSVTNSGVIATATDQITGIDLSDLADGTITLSVTLTDVNGNVGAAATDTETKETVAPSGYSVAIDQSPINGGNDDVVSFTFSGAEVGATYNYTFTTSGDAGSVANSGVIATATDQITGIDLSGLADGTISLSVTLTDVNGNVGAAATDTETKETVAPSGYSVTIDQSPINGGNDAAVSFTFSGAEVGATYNYTFTTSGGAGSVTNSGVIATATDQITGIDLSGLADGTISLSVTLTDVNGNVGAAATDTETKETVAPSGYSMAIDQSPINGGNDDAVSFTFSGAEVGATYNYTFTTSGGAGSVINSGVIATATDQITGIDLSGLADGTITLSVTLTDVNGNVGVAATDTETKETVAPTGYSVSIDQSPINGGNDDAVSFTFSGAEVGATYNYTFTTSGGAGSVTNSGVIATATDQITSIDLNGLADGTITLSVTLTDVNGNVGSAATDTETKEVVAPTVLIATTEADPTANDPIVVNVTFSESVSGFTSGDLTISNGAAEDFLGSGSMYTFNLVPDDSGDITVDVAANVAMDASGNGNTVASQFEITYDEDGSSPTITSSETSPTDSNIVPVTVTFDEEVRNFTSSDLVITNGSVRTFNTTDNITFEVTINPETGGALTVNIPMGAAIDVLGNQSSAATEFSIVVNGDSISIDTPIATDNVIDETESEMLVISGTSEGRNNASSFTLEIGSVSESVSIENDGTWSVTVDVSGLANGSYNVSINGPDSFGFSIGDTVSITLDQQTLNNETFNIDRLISIETVIEDKLVIDGTIEVVSVAIYDLSGALVTNSTNVSSIASGVYIAVVETVQGIITEKVIKK